MFINKYTEDGMHQKRRMKSVSKLLFHIVQKQTANQRKQKERKREMK